MDPVMMRGTTVDGEHWTLTSESTPRGPGVLLGLRSATGREGWGTGALSTPLPPGRVTGGVTGVGREDESATWLIMLRGDVRAAVAQLSDGTREDLRVVDDPRVQDLRWAVLLYPRHLDVHRLDVYDASGATLQDTAPTS